MSITVNPSTYQTSNINKDTGLLESESKSLRINPSSIDTGSNVLGLGAQGHSKYDVDINRYNTENLAQFRGERQGAGSQLVNALTQAVVGEIVGGTLEGIGWLGELRDTADMLDGKEVELGNWLTDLGKGLREGTREAAPIYTTYDQGFHPGKWSWWMSNAPSVASTLSLLIPATGVVKGVSMLGKAAGLTNTLAKTGKALGMSVRTAQLFEKGAIGISQAVLSRHMENLMEASGKYDELIKSGASKQNASQAAADIYKADWAMLAFDIPQYLTLGRSYGKATNQLTSKAAKELGKSTLKPNVIKTLDTAGNLIGEGIEEGYQYIVAEHYGELAKKRMDSSYEPKNLKEYLKDGDMWTNAFFGLFGAGVHQTAGRYINKKLFNSGNEDDQQVQSIKDWSAISKQLITAREEAKEIGDKEAFDHLNYRLATSIAARSSENGTLQAAIDTMTDAMSTDPSDESLELLGLDANDVANMKESFPDYIKTMQNIGDTFESLMKDKNRNYTPQEASTIALSSVMKEYFTNRYSELDKQSKEVLNRLENGDLNYKKLSSVGKQRLELDTEIANTKHKIKFLDNAIQRKDITSEREEALISEREEYKDKLAELENKTKELMTDEAYDPKVKKEDTSNLQKINKFMKDNYIAIKRNMDYLESIINLENANIEFVDNLRDLINRKQTGAKPTTKKKDDIEKGKDEAVKTVARDKITSIYEEEELPLQENIDKQYRDILGRVLLKTDYDLKGNNKINKLLKTKSAKDILTSDLNKELRQALESDKQLKLDYRYLRLRERIKRERNITEPKKEEKKFIDVSKEGAEERRFYKRISSLSDDLFFEEVGNIYDNLRTILNNLRNYDYKYDYEKEGVGLLYKETVRKLEFLDEQIFLREERQKDNKQAIPLEQYSQTTKNFYNEIREQEYDSIFNKVKIVEENVFEIRGKLYRNLYTESEKKSIYDHPAINRQEKRIKGRRDKKGDIISVTLTNENNKSVTFKDPDIVNEVSYYLLLQNYNTLIDEIDGTETNEIREEPFVVPTEEIVEEITPTETEDTGVTSEEEVNLEELSEKELGERIVEEQLTDDLLEELDKQEEVIIEEKQKETFDKSVIEKKIKELKDKKLRELLPRANDAIPVIKVNEDGTSEQGMVYRANRKYYYKDKATLTEQLIDNKASSTFAENGFFPIADPTTYKSLLPIETESDEDNIAVSDLFGSEAEMIEAVEQAKDVMFEVGHFPDGPNGDVSLEEYLQDRNNTLSEAHIEPFIDPDAYTLENNESLLNKLKRALDGELGYEDFTQEELDNIPIAASLIDGGKVISNKLFFYTSDFKLKARKPHPITLETDEKKADVLKEEYAKEFSKKNREIRNIIIKNYLDNKTLRIKINGKTRGVTLPKSKNTKTQRVDKALNVELKNIKGNILISISNNRLVNYIGKAIGVALNASQGGIFFITNKTSNGKNFPIKLKSRKVSKEHASIVLDAFKALVDKGKDVAFTHNEVTGNFTAGAILRLLVNSGDRTNINHDSHAYLKGANLERYNELKRKQLYLKDNVLHYGNSGKLDLSTDISPADKKAFIEYINANMNYPVRYKQLNDVYSEPFKVGEFELTKEDIDNGINTHEQYIIKNGYVLSDIVLNPNTDSITHKPEVILDINSIDQIETDDNTDNEDLIKSRPDEVNADDISELNDILDEFGFITTGDSNVKTRLYSNTTNYTVWNKKKEIAKIRKMIGEKIPIEIVDKLIEVIDDQGMNHQAWGIVKNASITLYNATESGTGYHEAFHIVTTYFLNDNEREQLYDDARSKFKELEGASDTVVDEYLAERFKDYILGQEPKSLSDKIRNFFKRLYNWITSVFIDKDTRVEDLTVNKLFDKIESGEYRKSKVDKTYANDNKINQLLSEKFSRYQINSITNSLFYTLVTVNNLTDIESVDVIDFGKVYDHMTSFRERLSQAVAANPTNAEFKRLEGLWTKVLSEDNWKLFEQSLDSRLRALDIKRIENDDEDTDDITSKEFQRFDKASYEFSGKDSLLSNIKLFISTLPENGQVDRYTGTAKLVDFQTAWSRIMKDAWKANNLNELEEIFNSKSERNTFYKILLDGKVNTKTGEIIRPGIRNGSSRFRTQIEQGFKKYKHEFINMISKSEVDDMDNKTFEYSTVSAMTTSAERAAAKDWGIQFYENSGIFNTEDKVDIKSLNAISNDFANNLLIKVVGEYSEGTGFKNMDIYIDKIISLFNDLYIPVDRNTLLDIIEDLGSEIRATEEDSDKATRVLKDKTEGLHHLVSNIMPNIFGATDSFLANLRSGAAFKKSGKKGTVRPEDLFVNDSAIKNFASLVVKHNDDYIQDIILGPDSANYYVYSQGSFLSDFFRRLKSNSYLAQLSEVVFNRNSYFLEQIRNGNELNIVTVANYREDSDNKGYLDLTDKQDFLFKFHLMHPFGKNSKAAIPLPTLADRKQYFAYTGMQAVKVNGATFKDGKIVFPKHVIDIFKGYITDEKNRIKKVKNDIDTAIENTKSKTIANPYKGLVQGIHYKKLDDAGNPILKDGDKYTGNGLNSIYFGDDVKFSDASINNILNERMEDTLQKAVDLGIIQFENKGGISNVALDHRVVSTYKSKFKSDNFGTDAIKALMAEYTINTIVSNIETDKLFAGDAAFYKADKKTGSVVEDKIKRVNALVAPGDTLRTLFEEGHELANKTTYNVGSIQDYEVDVEVVNNSLYNNLKRLFENYKDEDGKGLDNNQINERLDGYHDNNVTDAQAYILPSMYRSLGIRLGEWKDNHEEAYKILTENKDLNNIPQDKLELVSEFLTEPLKFVHYGLYLENGYAIPIYDKMSMATLWPALVKGKDLEVLYNKMEKDNIELIKFPSAVKVGNRPGAPKFYDKNERINKDYLNNISVYEQSFDNLRRQQITTPHDSASRMLATQVKKIILANLRAYSNYKIGDKDTYNGSDVARIINDSYKALSDKGLKNLEKIIGVDLTTGTIDVDKLYERLQDDAVTGNMPQQIIDAFTLREDGTRINIDTLPDRKWVETRISSLIAKQVIDLNTPGDAYAQMTTFGLQNGNRNKLKLIDDNLQTEIMVSVRLYKNVIPDYATKTFKEKVAWLNKNREVVEGIGYRIPTQGQNSVISFKVKEFLPETSASTVILPAEFTTLTGSDFDIDKLFLATYNYKIIGDRVEKIQFIEGDKNGKMTKESLMALYQQRNGDKIDYIKRLEDRLINPKKEITPNDVEYIRDNYPSYITDGGVLIGSKINDLIKDINNSLEADQTQFIKDNKGKDAYELNTSKAIQNRVLDTMKAVITNPDHILETKTPLDTFTNKIKEIVAQVRQAYGLDKKFSSLEALSPVYQLLVKSAYTGGKKGIGPFALHNVHHALTQIYDVESDTVSFARQLGNDNFFIIEWLSALINAHVDIAKDPYIFDLNINQSTYDITNYLIRAGYGRISFYFLTLPGVMNYEKAWEATAFTKATEGLKDAKDVDEIKTQVNSIISNYSNPEFLLRSVKDTEMITMMEDYNKPEDERNWEWYAKQVGIKQALKTIKNEAKALSDLVNVSRIDGKGFGNTSIEIYNFEQAYQDVIDNSPLTNVDGILEESFIGRYKHNAFGSMKASYSETSLASSDIFRDMHSEIMRNIPVPKAEDFKVYSEYIQKKNDYNKLFNKMENELFSALVSRYFHNKKGFGLDTKESVKNLLMGKNAVAARFYKVLHDHPELEDNYFIKHIKPLKPYSDNKDEFMSSLWLVKALNGDKTDRFQRDNIVDGWEDILEHNSDDVRTLGEQLVALSFLTSGFNRRLYSFYHNIPIDFLMKKSEFMSNEDSQSYNDYISTIKRYLNNGTIDNNFRDNVINDVISNNLNDLKKYIPTIATGAFTLSRDIETKQPLYFKSKKAAVMEYWKVNTNDGVFVGELVGYDEIRGEALYRIILDKGIHGTNGYHLLENAYKGSILNNYTELSKQSILDHANNNSNDKFKDNNFMSIESNERVDTAISINAERKKATNKIPKGGEQKVAEESFEAKSKRVHETILNEGSITKGDYVMNKAEWLSMSKADQDNFITCL